MTLPFSTDEYEARRRAVRAELATRELDLLLVTQPANLYYLTGYEASWYPPRLPVGALIDRESTRVIALDWDRHDGYVKSCVLADDFVLFKYGQATAAIRDFCAGQGWRGRSVGIEWSSPTPAAPVMLELARTLTAAGLRIESADWLVDNLRLYKSDAELACIRAAARMADRAMLNLWRELRPGLSELEVSARLAQWLAAEGSEIAAMDPLVNSGPQAWRDVHAFASTRVLQPGDLVTVDCCAVSRRYHANLGRSFVLGTAAEAGPGAIKARDIIRRGAGSFAVLRDQALLDGDPGPAMAAAERFVRDRVPAENVWWIGGYSLGIHFPPSWVGHTYLANDGLQKCTLRRGSVFNFENVYVDRVHGFEGGAIDTIVMTDAGFELMSQLPRELLEAPP